VTPKGKNQGDQDKELELLATTTDPDERRALMNDPKVGSFARPSYTDRAVADYSEAIPCPSRRFSKKIEPPPCGGLSREVATTGHCVTP